MWKIYTETHRYDVPKSKSKTPHATPRAIRARLIARGTSVPQIARKHGAKVSSLYMVLNGERAGNRTPELQSAMKELTSV